MNATRTNLVRRNRGEVKISPKVSSCFVDPLNLFGRKIRMEEAAKS